MTPTINSYFSGAGLMDSGLVDAGVEIQQSFEIDSNACKTHRANFDHEVVEGDLTQTLVKDQMACDAMVFTYPCTKYSTIADIQGTRNGDDLFLHALRHIAVAGPEVFVIENVPGMRAFPLVMEAMTRLADYYCEIKCPVKAEWFVPQRRDRLIIFCSRKPFSWREPEKKKPKILAEVIESEPKITYPDAIYQRMAGVYRDAPIISNPNNGDIAPTVMAHYHKDKSTRLVTDERYPLGVRPYSVRECARLMGLDDSFTFPVSDSQAYKQIGNGVVKQIGEWIGNELKRYFKRSTTCQ